jgi:holo-[acyl-carrier-protein] synthase
MVLGIGLDALNVARMTRELAREDGGFLDAVFTPREVAECAGDPREFALRFALKEAASKALGTGMRDGVSWPEIEVLRSGPDLPRSPATASMADDPPNGSRARSPAIASQALKESQGGRRIVWHGGTRACAGALGVCAAWLSCAIDGELAVAWVVLEG